MRSTDIIRALQKIPVSDVWIADGKILYAPDRKDPSRVYVLPIEESHAWNGRKDHKGKCKTCAKRYMEGWVHMDP